MEVIRILNKKILLGIISILMLFLIGNVELYGVENTKIPVELSIINNTGNINDRFRFEMIPKNENNPMPENTENGIYSIVVQDSGTYYIDEIDFDVPGVYEYEVYQVNKNNADYIYDESIYKIIIDVRNTENLMDFEINTIISKYGSDEKYDSIVFTNEEQNKGGNIPDTSDIKVYCYSIIFIISVICLVCNLRKKYS